MRGVIKCLLLVFCVTGFFTFISADKNDKINAKAYVLMEAETRTVLESENADIRLNAGYMNKLMSLIIIANHIENGAISLNDELIASDSVRGIKGSVVWLESGDKMTVDELLKSVIVGNANDALTVLAEAVSGNINTFVMDMNAEAFEMGLRDTYYTNPYGYYDEREYTTAHDIGVVCAKLAEFDFLTQYFKTWRDFVKDEKVELVNENTLSRTYEPHIGFKVCHSEEYGYCLAEGGRNSENNTFIAVIIGANSEDDLFRYGKKLVKKGFSGYKVVLSEFPDEMLMPLKVKNGTFSAVEMCIKEQGKMTVPKDKRNIRTKVVVPEYITAPVREGQSVGCAAFYNDDTLVFETDIITKSSVKSLTWYYILKRSLFNMIEKAC